MAWAAVVAVHVALLWWLAQPVTWEPRAEQGVLQVEWIDRPAAVRPALPPAPARVTSERAPIDAVSAGLPRNSGATTIPAPAPQVTAADDRPLSAVVLEQGRRWAEDMAPIGDFRRDPLGGHSDPTGLPRPDRFHMRTELSPQRIVQAVGVLFGGAGYTTDPCARVHGNLANLGTGRERNLVDEEVRRLQKFCQ